jgi:vanillate O-demethylase monooxygenase subunit
MRFLINSWYVALFSKEVSRAPRRQIVLGNPVVMYRKEDGSLVALADRCPHRFAPLSRGQLVGDDIQCPYHGLRFDSKGHCVFNPHGTQVPPKAAQIAAYPVVERDGLVWLWPGDPEAAEEALAPDLGEFLDAGRNTLMSGVFTIKANYMLVIDNLLDLSHAPFIHSTTLANPEDMALLRVEIKQNGNTVHANHYIDQNSPSPQFKPFWPEGQLGDSRAHMRWDPPCNLQLDVGITAIGRPPEEGPYLHMVHLLTPVNETETRYYWIAARNMAVGNEEVSHLMTQAIMHAFQAEDEPIIEAIQENMGTTDLMSLKPVLLSGDGASVRARRIIESLIKDEIQAHGPASALAIS